MMSVKSTYKVGVIGCGNVTRKIHMASLLKNKDINIVAVCDLDEKAAKRVQPEIEGA